MTMVIEMRTAHKTIGRVHWNLSGFGVDRVNLELLDYVSWFQ
jgi:hypothetical protein